LVYDDHHAFNGGLVSCGISQPGGVGRFGNSGNYADDVSGGNYNLGVSE